MKENGEATPGQKVVTIAASESGSDVVFAIRAQLNKGRQCFYSFGGWSRIINILYIHKKRL
ncbi:uncharacterized protein PHALS_15264 [Plasmopara halstedii]|uniref:Uncharacterized protein n=1 Tax=Plasmopara halstedii TaxID=4781 RepID=A0A0N7L6K0_PLAHL|nr:uncharacterized protein PHALS_15264 [Plasmopara halstedii]CEG44491.1 hypothetical protein PHALS_15264 [Plasmopara halstedii]|eukprot:XP_024580860.1 hypothetical protein PHALS_15264 [Plasmopara halstedii]